MQRWEYCAIFGANKSERDLTPKYPTLVYFTKKGAETVRLDNRSRAERPLEWQDAEEGEYVAHIIATLGLDGWELLSTFAGALGLEGMGSTAFYFKRPVDTP